jgi:hypothetical protein
MFMMNIDHAPLAFSRLNLLSLPCGLTTCEDMSSHHPYSPNVVESRILRTSAIAYRAKQLSRLANLAVGYTRHLANPQGGRQHQRWQDNLRGRNPDLHPHLASPILHRQARVGDLRRALGPDYPQLGSKPSRGRLEPYPPGRLAQRVVANKGR